MTDGVEVLREMLDWLDLALSECSHVDALNALVHIEIELGMVIRKRWIAFRSDVLDAATERDRETRMRPAFERAHGPEVPGDLMKP